TQTQAPFLSLRLRPPRRTLFPYTTLFRSLHRLLTRRALLFTEMITTGAIIHGGAERHLAFGGHEHPVALQLGGSDPAELAVAIRSEEHTSELQSRENLVCRLLLEKKKVEA